MSSTRSALVLQKRFCKQRGRASQKRFCESRHTPYAVDMTRKPGRVGMRDVAAAAEVSVTTVSDALNGKGRLPEQTRDHVRTVARRLGYRPSLVARGLASRRAGNLALTISTQEGSTFAFGALDYFVQLMSSATSTALEHGYALSLLHRDSSGLPLDLPVDGAIVVDPVVHDVTLSQLREHGVPTVTTGRDPALEDGAWQVDNDHAAGTEKILQHLRGAGAGRIALISGPPVHSYIVDAVRAYEQWCTRHGDAPMHSVAKYSQTEAAGYTAASALLSHADRPDAIYATLDRLALGAALAARASELTVPDDLLLAGLSDSEASRTATPPLTTLALNPTSIAQRAVEMLVALVEGRSVADPQVTVPTRVIARTSTRRSATRVH
jgi:DNA-binding LacI/PurR family transcriptional regulator